MFQMPIFKNINKYGENNAWNTIVEIDMNRDADNTSALFVKAPVKPLDYSLSWCKPCPLYLS